MNLRLDASGKIQIERRVCISEGCPGATSHAPCQPRHRTASSQLGTGAITYSSASIKIGSPGAYCLHWNTDAEHMFGFRRDEVIGTVYPVSSVGAF
jgi:hypothetical protein